MSYKDDLLDPRWQRRRLEIMQRDDFSCVSCGATKKTLHVHHSWYIRGLKPWEYEDHSLSTLCSECHERVTHQQDRLSELLSRMGESGLAEVAGFILGLIEITTGEKYRPRDAEELYGMAQALWDLNLRNKQVFRNFASKLLRERVHLERPS